MSLSHCQGSGRYRWGSRILLLSSRGRSGPQGTVVRKLVRFYCYTSRIILLHRPFAQVLLIYGSHLLTLEPERRIGLIH